MCFSETDHYAYHQSFWEFYYRRAIQEKPIDQFQEEIDMETVNILHMNTGDGESSYASNSLLQRCLELYGKICLQERVIKKTLPILKHAIKDIANHDGVLGQCFKVADLGCSSSKNTLLVISNIIDIVIEVSKANNTKVPQLQVCLNDLIGNDFNYLFKLLPDFYAMLKKEKGDIFGNCFVSAIPGSFYDRLFPDKSLHLVHSSYSLHWLSQVPEGLENNQLNIYIAKTSPPNVFQSYEKQFHTDFAKFLQMRSEEVVCGGCMVLIIVGRRNANPSNDDSCHIWELLAQSLVDMVQEGLVRESDVKSFNVPIYYPCEGEVWNAIQYEGSFSLDNLNVFELNWDPNDAYNAYTNDITEPNQTHGENIAKVVRAFSEPLLIYHFGSSIIDELFKRYGNHVTRNMAKKKTRYFNLVISLTKK
ncbi:probable jasmonic acid carboxyl methyltransferase 2 [Rutidosis leptorrhynchoides]|uniref:probable jasmonic acid carboxyl methyltransferase 2 n=1 Tax=Rutidosis leptorrhynchoides TaxID=125765 RepID=UPI003A999161